jgi:hypothetical protein
LIEFEETEINCTIWSHKMQKCSNFGTPRYLAKGYYFVIINYQQTLITILLYSPEALVIIPKTNDQEILTILKFMNKWARQGEIAFVMYDTVSVNRNLVGSAPRMLRYTKIVSKIS